MTEPLPIFNPLPKESRMATQDHTVRNYIKLIHHLGGLIERGVEKSEDLRKVDARFTPHPMTYLKLLLACSYARQFLTRSKVATHRFYLDVLSASGLSYTKNHPDDPIAGSSFLTPLAHQNFQSPSTPPSEEFDKVWCFDMDSEALSAIRKRRDALVCRGICLPPFELVAGDANKYLDTALTEIETISIQERANRKLGPLTLVFVDNLSMDITMDTIADIQNRIRADLIVHIPTHAIWRCIEANRKSGTEQHKLTAFFGCEDWKTIENKHEIPGLYHKQVQNLVKVDLQEFQPVEIKGSDNTFHLAVYVRHTAGTKGKDGWVATIRKVAEACNSIDFRTIENIKATALQRQATLF